MISVQCFTGNQNNIEVVGGTPSHQLEVVMAQYRIKVLQVVQSSKVIEIDATDNDEANEKALAHAISNGRVWEDEIKSYDTITEQVNYE
jgi:hypothetical protein